MSALVLIELNGSEVSANSRAAITAAAQLSDTIDALVLTNTVDNASQTSSLAGLSTVKVIINDELSFKVILPLINIFLFSIVKLSFLDKETPPR